MGVAWSGTKVVVLGFEAFFEARCGRGFVMPLFRRKHRQAQQNSSDAELDEMIRRYYGVEPDDGFTAVLIGRRADGPGNGVMKYTLTVHGPGHQEAMLLLRLGMSARETQEHAKHELPGPLRGMPVVLGPRVLKWQRTTYDCRPEAERVLASKGWHVSGDWIALIGRGRWFNGDHGSWAAPVTNSR